MYYVQIVAWLACGVYATIPAFWLMVHPFAERWRTSNRSPFRVLAPAWVVMWIVSWIASLPLRNFVVIDSRAPWLLVPIFWAMSLYIYIVATRGFTLDRVIGRHEVETRHAPALVTNGLHARMRHPLYFGHLCTMLGWLCLARTAAVLSLTVFAVATGIFLIRSEDAELERRFGASYREYKKRTPAVLPRLL